MKGEPLNPAQCSCPLDQDGQCDACRKRSRDAMRGFGTGILKLSETLQKAMLDFQENIQQVIEEAKAKEGCTGCERRYMDWAFSQMLGELGDAQVTRELVDATILSVQQAFRNKGITEWPLVTKAYQKLYAVGGKAAE